MNYKNTNLGDKFCNIGGEVINYEVANGLQNIGGNYRENLMNADGNGMGEFETTLASTENLVDDNYYGANGDDEYYNAGGLFSNYRKQQKERQSRRTERSKSRNDARKTRGEASKMRAEAKQGQSLAQIESAKSLGKGVEGDIAMANALASKTPESTGMSTGAKVGIAIGVVAVLGLVGFVIYKKMKKK